MYQSKPMKYYDVRDFIMNEAPENSQVGLLRRQRGIKNTSRFFLKSLPIIHDAQGVRNVPKSF